MSEQTPDQEHLVQLLVALREAEKSGVAPAAAVKASPMGAFLLANALELARKAPDLPADQVLAADLVAVAAFDGLRPEPAAVIAVMQAEAMGLTGGEEPTPAYRVCIDQLLAWEGDREQWGTIAMPGPYTAVLVCGLLQLVLRHPAYSDAGDFARNAVYGFARQIQSSFSPEYQALLETGFDVGQDHVSENEAPPWERYGAAPGTPILCPYCPYCGQEPTLVIGGGAQAVCGNKDCDAVMWNALVDNRGNLANLHQIDLAERDDLPSAGGVEQGGGEEHREHSEGQRGDERLGAAKAGGVADEADDRGDQAAGGDRDEG